jgi:hypothetical protein
MHSGNITGAIDKSDSRRTHVSDALGYLVQQEFALAMNAVESALKVS